MAVTKWFDNPRHYEVTRDIGELLNKTEYEDDLNLNDGGDEEEPTESDEEFIVEDEDEDFMGEGGSSGRISVGDEGSDDEQASTAGEGYASGDKMQGSSTASHILSDNSTTEKRRKSGISDHSLHVRIS